ncbi:MAG: hypothetical protein HYW79_02875 [Parcubacteria group bacterium]|nr:hypothetical protein [Parcubacteria group bacterium]
MKKFLTPKIFSVLSPLIVFFVSGIVWLMILTQRLGFFSGLLLLSFFTFLLFWRGLLISRQAGELFGLRAKHKIFIVCAAATLGFSELIWTISFLPFAFFILSGIFAVIFSICFDILKEYFKRRPGLFRDYDKGGYKKILYKDICGGAILIIIFILISSWLPARY